MNAPSDPLKAANRAFVDARAEVVRFATDKSKLATAKRKMFRAAAEVIELASMAEQPLGPEVMLLAQEVFAYLATGRLSPMLDGVLRDGNIQTVELLSCKRAAVLYMRAAENGIIANRNPTHTLCTAFDIDDSTLARWRSDCFDASTDPDLFIPDDEPAARGTAEDIADDGEPLPLSDAERDRRDDLARQDAVRLSQGDNPQRIRALMLRAAEHYQLIRHL